MRIAISTLTTTSEALGVGRYIQSLIDALQEIDSTNEYFIFTSIDNYRLFNLYKSNFQEVRTKFTHSPRWLMRPAYFIWQNSLFLTELNNLNIDVLHLPNLLPLFFDKIPTVVTIHDLGEYKISRKYGRLRQWYRQTIMPLTVHKAKRVIAVSHSTKNDLFEFLQIPLGKIDVTYEGVADIFFSEIDARTSQNLLDKYISSPYILYAGALYAHKNLERLIRAFQLLKVENGVPHKLLIVGKKSGALYLQLVDLIKQLGIGEHVIFTDYVPAIDLVNLFRNASVMAYIPLNEGFGLPVLEAMASGVPVVASNTSSIPEVAGDAALLVDPIDIHEIASALGRLLADSELRQALISLGHKQVQKFSWQKCAEQTLQIYYSAAKG